MHIYNPILFGPTPAGGVVLDVGTEPGALIKSTLLGLNGPPATVEVSVDGGAWIPVAYPLRLRIGQRLRLTRTDASALLTTLRMLTPAQENETATGAPIGPLANGVPVTVTVLGVQSEDDPVTLYSIDLPAGTSELVFASSGGAVMLALSRYPDVSNQPEVLSDTALDPNRVSVTNPPAGRWYAIAVVEGADTVPDVTLTATW